MLNIAINSVISLIHSFSKELDWGGFLTRHKDEVTVLKVKQHSPEILLNFKL